MKKLEIYLQALQVGQHEKRIMLEAINELNLCTPQELSKHRLLVAALYYQLLQYCQSMYEGNVPNDVIVELFNLFENIEHISVEATQEERCDSSLITIWFLHELKAHKDAGDVWRIEDDWLQKSIQILINELDKIYFVFDIKEQDEHVFPIHSMIAKVVERPEFVDINNPLGVYQIHILQLAVRLFVNSEDKQKILQTLIDQYNLRFINYLNTSGNILDTSNLLNYQKNGVMVFYDSMRNRVLVRHKSRHYFESAPLWELDGIVIEEETDRYSNKISYFVEYELENSDSLKDYSEVLRSEEGRQNFLGLVFGKKAYNILIENSIIQKSDGSLLPLNPYCYNDNKIVKGRIKDKTGTVYEKDCFIDAVTEYRSSALKICKESVMNRVSLGLAILLLQKENVGVERLGLDELIPSDWYQSQVLKNWVKQTSDPVESMVFILGQWQRQNEYCTITYKNNKSSKGKSIEEHEIVPLDFYPLKTNNNWMYEIVGDKNTSECYVLKGKFQDDGEGTLFLIVDLVSDVVGRKFSKDTGESQLLIEIYNINDPEKILEDVWENGEEYFVLYNNNEHSCFICSQIFLKLLSAFERIQNKNYLTLETISEISRTQYDKIVDRMLLHKDAFEEVGKKCFCDFDSQVYYRLLHNMLWSEINNEKIKSYLRIFMHHQKLDFSNINSDEIFMRKDKDTLYVPKDGRESDSVLTSIYNTYLRSRSIRDTNDMYNGMIELKKDGYYYKENRIEKILFLCDNFEYGTATIRMLKAYLNIDISEDDAREKNRIEQVKASRQKYFTKDNNLVDATEHHSEVLLDSIIEKNNCAIEVHGYYGTEIGKKTIENFLEGQNIKNFTVTYERLIEKQAIQIMDDIKMIWPKNTPCETAYTVVREFNMTKLSVFPEEMLKNAEKAICMFVKKDEIKK